MKVEYRDGIVYITGGAGLGKGQYDGRYSELVSHTYSGIKSINGLRSDRNINITMSDLLLANGALVRTGYDKKDQTGNTE